MAFIEIPGLKGKVYVPDASCKGVKKHPCRDCFSCQWCGDDRCCICRKQKQCPQESHDSESGPCCRNGF